MTSTNSSILEREEIDDEFEGFSLPDHGDLFQLDGDDLQWLFTFDTDINLEPSVETPSLKRKSAINFDENSDHKRSCFFSEYGATNFDDTIFLDETYSATNEFDTLLCEMGKFDDNVSCSTGRSHTKPALIPFEDEESLPLSDIFPSAEYEANALQKDYGLDYLHDDKDGASTSSENDSQNEVKVNVDGMLCEMEKFLKFSNDTERSVNICEAKICHATNFLLMEMDIYVQVQLEVYRNCHLNFQIVLNLYGAFSKHKGNQNSCFINFQFTEGAPWRIADLNKVILIILDFLIDQRYRRCYFSLDDDKLAKYIIDNAYASRKLQPQNCDIPQLTVDEKKWRRILNKLPIIYGANQMLSNQHWTEGKLDTFPLYLPVFEKMENELKRILPSAKTRDFYEQFRIDNEFKTQWKKFRRVAKEKILPEKDSIYILCLIPREKLRQIIL